jgi:hypothetical protein
LSQVSIICKVFGSQPNRQELCELLYARLQTEASKIKDIQFMGKGFYYIEFSQQETVVRMLECKFLDLKGAQAMLLPWHQGFNTTEAATQTENMAKVMAIFPRLPKEYMSLPRIGWSIGLPLETVESMVAQVERANGLPSS